MLDLSFTCRIAFFSLLGSLSDSTISNDALAKFFDNIAVDLQKSSDAVPLSAELSSSIHSTGQLYVPEDQGSSLIEKGACIINVGSSSSSKRGSNRQILVKTKSQDKGQKRSTTRGHFSHLSRIPSESLVFPDAPSCQHCGVKRFHLESPNFCWRRGLCCAFCYTL